MFDFKSYAFSLFFSVFFERMRNLGVNHDRVNGVVLAIKRCVLVEFVV